MRDWRGTQTKHKSPANKALAEAIAERREHQKQLAQWYQARREEAAAWARNERDKRAAIERAKLAEQGVTFDPKTGEPVLTIRSDTQPYNPS
ncbi:MAG: hypothetical protein WBB05_31935 [Mycolicibacterium fortuitum]|nr:hypothetical protein [Mycolicibacterium fortuitum]OBB42963.1 hypothetical protein A5754_13485 [Mycolicibacterium fortuitum]OBB52166.1 hypothetical protein A5755_33025 [Mycolicibacterium fortuitum]OBF79435.1 hypothetical protein A5751_19145 [Mycolicibacterium fortuitum]